MISILKIIYIHKLGDIVNKYNTCHRIIKMTPSDVKSRKYIDFDVKNNDKDRRLEFGDQVQILKNIKAFLQSFVVWIGQKNFLSLTKSKILYHEHT